jgi:hypothetical protein
MLRIEKKIEVKIEFSNFFAESKKNALGKEILCREPVIWLLAKKSVPSVYFFAESFLVGSRQRSHFDECFFFGGSFSFCSRQSLLCREFFI